MKEILSIIEMEKNLIQDGYLKIDILNKLKQINPNIETLLYFLDNSLYKM